MLRQFIVEDQGQDLVEYGLLGALVAIVGFAAWVNLGTAIGSTYASWDTGLQNLSATTPDPTGGGS